jgi:hypothetical protein
VFDVVPEMGHCQRDPFAYHAVELIDHSSVDKAGPLASVGADPYE